MRDTGKIGKSDIIAIAAGLSTFFAGGEVLEFKYGISALILILVLMGRSFIGRRTLLFMAGVSVLTVYHIVSGNISTELINGLIFSCVFALLLDIRFDSVKTAGVLVFTAIIHALISVIQHIFFGIYRPPSTFVNPNWASLWIFAGLYVLVRHMKVNMAVKWSAALIMLWAIYYQRSRSVILLLVLTAVYEIIRNRKRKRAVVMAVLLVLACVLGVLRLKDDLTDELAFSRGKIYSAGIRAFLSRPAAGYGNGSVSGILPGYAGPEKRRYSNYSVSPRMTHSSYLEILVTGGVAGFLLFLILLRGRVMGHRFKELLFLMMAAGLFNNIEKSFSLVLLMGVLLSFGKGSCSEKGIMTKRNRTWVPVLLAVGFMALQYSAFLCHKSAEKNMEKGKFEDAGKMYRRAYTLDFTEPFYAREYAMYLLHNEHELRWDDKVAQVESLTDMMIKYGKYDPENYYFKANFYNILLRLPEFRLFKPELHEKALGLSQTAIELNPRNVSYLYQKMLFHAYRSDTQALYGTWQRLLTLERYHMKSYRLIAEVTVDTSLKEVAMKKIAEIEKIRDENGLNKYEKMMMSD